MKGYFDNIEQATLNNADFRRVLYTGRYSQLVLMSLKPGEEIGSEVHPDVDQFFRFDEGLGRVVIDGVAHEVRDGFGVVVPAGAEHNVINTGTVELKLYTLYSPPKHQDGTLRVTKEDAVSGGEEHFDGRTTE